MYKVLAIMVPIIGILTVGFLGVNYYTPENISLTVNDAVRECKGTTSECRYVVYTSEGVFENKDTLIFLKFNSSDLHNQLLGMKGKQTSVKAYGLRIPFLSTYKNIVEVVE
jgi:transketolase N-terminal domain/subunit